MMTAIQKIDHNLIFCDRLAKEGFITEREKFGLICELADEYGAYIVAERAVALGVDK